MMNLIKQIFISMRPQQWCKNLFVLAAVIFAGNLKDITSLAKSLVAFMIFCGLSGAVYIINDIKDIKEDRNHPLKNRRPIASGKLKIKPALSAAIIIITIGILFSFLLPLEFTISAIAYLLLTFSYSLHLRKLVIMDVIAVSLGYVLRVLAGGFAISILSSPWSLIMTFFLAIFISLIKRRSEKIQSDRATISHRNLIYFREETLDYLIIISATCVIITYTLFTIFSGKNINLYLTIPFVLYGVFRYMYLAFEYNLGEEPANVFIKDRPLFYNILLWVIISVIIIYFT